MRTLLPVSILAIAPFVNAQVYSPSNDYSNSEGGGSSTTFFSYAAGRYQFADDNHTGGTMTVTGVACRLDQSNYTATDGTGRAFTNVVINASNTVYSTFGANFAANVATTPVRVFDAGVNLPTQVGPTTNVPAPFAVTFPFSTSFAYDGTNALLTDWTFTGGTLANSAAWSGATSVPYRVDSFSTGPSATGASVTLGNIATGCRDTNGTGANGASLNLITRTHGPNDPTPALQNKYFVEVTGSDFAPNHNALMFLAFESDVVGLQFPGVTCNNVHLPLAGRTWFAHPLTTDAVGGVAPYNLGVPGGIANYTPLWHGIPLFVQAAWSDSSSGDMKFSSGSRTSFMALPPADTAAVGMKTAFDADPAATAAGNTADGDPNSIPIFQYSN